jgi:hypothetical protein
MTLAEIEVHKHQASWLNALATAVGTTGVLAPLAALLTGVIPTETSAGLVLSINGFCVIMAVALHIQGERILSELE